MRYTLIKGSFHVVGQSPDGDSIKFRAANPALWDTIQSANRELFIKNFHAATGIVNVRLEAIDALETHYTPPKPTTSNYKPKGYAQPAYFGRLSANTFLEMLGVTDIKWRTFGKSLYISQAVINGVLFKTKLTDTIPGFIVTGDFELNGRPVVWVFAGDTDMSDGMLVDKMQLANIVPKSANYQLLRAGLVYPLFISTLPAVVRHVMAEAVNDALLSASKHVNDANPPANIWLIDYSVRGIELSSFKLLTESHAIYPYLFRRIIKHYQDVEVERLNMGQPSSESIPLTGFFKDGNPTIFVVSEQDFLHLDEIVEAEGMTIRMKNPPHDLVFLA